MNNEHKKISELEARSGMKSDQSVRVNKLWAENSTHKTGAKSTVDGRDSQSKNTSIVSLTQETGSIEKAGGNRSSKNEHLSGESCTRESGGTTIKEGTIGSRKVLKFLEESSSKDNEGRVIVNHSRNSRNMITQESITTGTVDRVEGVKNDVSNESLSLGLKKVDAIFPTDDYRRSFKNGIESGTWKVKNIDGIQLVAGIDNDRSDDEMGLYKRSDRDKESLDDLISKTVTESRKSFRATLVHTSTRNQSSLQIEDHTIRGEGEFLKNIEKYKNKRLERLCICPVTRWLLFKEKMAKFNSVFCRIERGLWILCCPPLCYILPQAAFWPPPNEYFFYMDNGPPRIRKEIEGREDAIEIAKRKKKFEKVYRANKKSWLQTGWRIGHQHPCADDIDNVEGFIVRTAKKNYIACVRIPTYGHSRYSILYSHPNASDLSDHITGVPNLIDIARFYKCDVYSYDYSGFGISSGHASESNIKADIKAVYDYMLNDRGVEPNRIILMGYSIGCFASVHLACTITNPPAGVVLQAPPTSVLRVLLWDRACFKKPFSDRSCCADRFSTYDMICKIRVPVLVVHGEDDRKVPIVHGKAVCERAVNRVAPLWLRATHDNIENCKATWIRIRDFMKYELKK